MDTHLMVITGVPGDFVEKKKKNITRLHKKGIKLTFLCVI